MLQKLLVVNCVKITCEKYIMIMKIIRLCKNYLVVKIICIMKIIWLFVKIVGLSKSKLLNHENYRFKLLNCRNHTYCKNH
jgi:hypothetical protein